MKIKEIQNGIIMSVGETEYVHGDEIEIQDEEFKSLSKIIDNKPPDTAEEIYELSAETETYLSRERTHREKQDWYWQQYFIGAVAADDIPQEYLRIIDEV